MNNRRWSRTKVTLVLTVLIVVVGGILLHQPLFNEPISESEFQNYDVTIYRDTWGVPHIFGQRDTDVAYGLGFAHAEDDFNTIQNTLLAVRGQRASIYGKKGATIDYLVHLLRIWEVVNKRYDTDLSPEVRAVCEAYADGLNHYALQHRKAVLPGLFPVQGKDIVAGFVFRTPLMFNLDQVLEKLYSESKPVFSHDDSGDENPYAMLASNVIAVGPKRSADGYTRIAINSHQPWEGPVTWYEVHLHSEEGWNIVGALFPGSPVVFKGHNPYLGWSHTVNMPDLVDVYELEMDPENPYRYRFDGRWLELEARQAPIQVKLWGPFYWTVKKEVLWSVYGPVIRRPHGVYAIRYAGHDEVRQVEEWYRMNKARNLEEFKTAMRLMAIPMFNTGYADREGNLFYVYNGLLPRRQEGFHWQGIVPGNTSATLWDQYLSFDELPQVTNPPSAFIESCNSTPFLTTVGPGNPDSTAYDSSLGIEDFQTNRALRSHETFGSDSSITREEFYRYKFDTRYSTSSTIARALKQFLSEAHSNDPEVKKALEVLRNWNLDTDQTDQGAALAILTINPSHNPLDFHYDYGELMERLKATISFLKTNYGLIDVPWGTVQRLRRGSVDLPLSGGPDVLRAIYTHEEDGHRVGDSGDCYFQIVEWSPSGAVSAASIHQYGAATLDSTSPHFADQAPLFAAHELKPVWMKLEEIQAHLERKYHPGE
jgi:penicillin amidase/acyl-homoserine-lactone acylase